MQERTNDHPPPHPFDTGPDEHTAHYGPGVQLGPADDSRHHDVDEADQHEDDDVEVSPDEAAEIERRRRVSSRRRPATRSDRPARSGRSSRPRGSTGRPKSRKGGEVTLGAVACAIGAAYGGYWLFSSVFGLSDTAALLVAGYAGGLCSGGVVWPLWRSARRAVGGWITPRGAR